MSMSDDSMALKPVRLWPGVLAAVLLVAARFSIPIVLPEQTIYAVLSGIGGGVAVIA